MTVGLEGRKRLERSCDFHIWKVLGGGGALRGLKRLTYDGVMYFYFRYPLRTTHQEHVVRTSLIKFLSSFDGFSHDEKDRTETSFSKDLFSKWLQ